MRSSDFCTFTSFNFFRFSVGPYEQRDFSRQASPERLEASPRGAVTRPWLLLSLQNVINESFRPVIEFLKARSRHSSCPHPHSCLHYTISGAAKQFFIGYGLQACLNLLLRFRKLARNPSKIGPMLFGKDAYGLAAFFGGFSGVFRVNNL